MYILDSPASKKGDVWLAVAQSQAKQNGSLPFPTSPWVRIMEQGHVRGLQLWTCKRFLSTSQKYIRLLSKSLQLPMWGSRVWGKAWDLSTVASNHELLPPYSFPSLFLLPSSKAVSVINDNLQSHTFTCPFWNPGCLLSMAIFFMVRRKDRPMWLKYWIESVYHIELLALMQLYCMWGNNLFTNHEVLIH